jgi:hypothetical protein
LPTVADELPRSGQQPAPGRARRPPRPGGVEAAADRRIQRHPALRRRHRRAVAAELAFDDLGQADAAAAGGELHGQLLVEQRLVHARFVAVEHAALGRRVAHGLEHLLEQQRLELLGGLLGGGRRAVLRDAAQARQGVGVEGVDLAEIGGHQITSSSARSAPLAFMAWRMAISSRGWRPGC